MNGNDTLSYIEMYSILKGGVVGEQLSIDSDKKYACIYPKRKY